MIVEGDRVDVAPGGGPSRGRRGTVTAAWPPARGHGPGLQRCVIVFDDDDERRGRDFVAAQLRVLSLPEMLAELAEG